MKLLIQTIFFNSLKCRLMLETNFNKIKKGGSND